MRSCNLCHTHDITIQWYKSFQWLNYFFASNPSMVPPLSLPIDNPFTLGTPLPLTSIYPPLLPTFVFPSLYILILRWIYVFPIHRYPPFISQSHFQIIIRPPPLPLNFLTTLFIQYFSYPNPLSNLGHFNSYNFKYLSDIGIFKETDYLSQSLIL